MSYLELKGVEKYYGDFHAIKGINLNIQKGEFIVFVGPSGCGKSTLLRMIAGLEDINGGDLVLDGKNITDMLPSKRDLAMVFQSYALYPHMTVEENMSFALRIQKEDPAVIKDKVAKAAEKLNLTDYLKRTPKELSGGQRQRVAIGRALVRDVDVFLFDEPLSNLDAKLRVDMRTEIKKLHQKLKTTVVYVTHDQIEALTLSTRIAVMYNGYVQQLGTPQEIYDTPANVFVATFMGSPAMNIVPAKVVINGDDAYAEIEDSNGAKQQLKFNTNYLQEWNGKEILLGIRPEAITDSEGADRNATNVQHLTNTVGVTEPAGSDTFVTMTLSGKDVIARMRADVNIAPEQSFDFAINMDKAVAFDPQSEERIKP